MMSRIKVLFLAIAVLITTWACNKEEDTTAEVRVVTANGTTVAGAEVRMFGQGTVDQTDVGDIRIDRTQFTASNGITTFDFTDLYVPGQSGFATLNVEITKEFPDSTAFLEGIMQVVEEEENRKTFILE
ncbi:MAG: hypothetical protein LC664_06110 [Flavobacteriales bacterium]|nr:hypothetical protein [Flavobacteriales bacterium]